MSTVQQGFDSDFGDFSFPMYAFICAEGSRYEFTCPTERDIYAFIYDRSAGGEKCGSYCTIPFLMTIFNCSRSTIKRSIHSLVEKGYIYEIDNSDVGRYAPRAWRADDLVAHNMKNAFRSAYENSNRCDWESDDDDEGAVSGGSPMNPLKETAGKTGGSPVNPLKENNSENVTKPVSRISKINKELNSSKDIELNSSKHEELISSHSLKKPTNQTTDSVLTDCTVEPSAQTLLSTPSTGRQSATSEADGWLEKNQTPKPQTRTKSQEQGQPRQEDAGSVTNSWLADFNVLSELSKNRNRLQDAYIPYCSLRRTGYDAATILAAYKNFVSQKEEQGLESRFYTRLSTWLDPNHSGGIKDYLPSKTISESVEEDIEDIHFTQFCALEKSNKHYGDLIARMSHLFAEKTDCIISGIEFTKMAELDNIKREISAIEKSAGLIELA